MPLVSKYDAKVKNICKIRMLYFRVFKAEALRRKKGKFLPVFLTSSLCVQGLNSLHIQFVTNISQAAGTPHKGPRNMAFATGRGCNAPVAVFTDSFLTCYGPSATVYHYNRKRLADQMHGLAWLNTVPKTSIIQCRVAQA